MIRKLATILALALGSCGLIRGAEATAPLLAPASIDEIGLPDPDAQLMRMNSEPPAEIVALPPSQRSLDQNKNTSKRTPEPSNSQTEKPKAMLSPAPLSQVITPAPTPLSPLLSYRKAPEPGYATVLSGTLTENLELTPQMSPVLIRGLFIVPEKVKLTIAAGTVLHLCADPDAGKSPADAPNGTRSAVLWVWGTLDVNGVTGHPVEFDNQEKPEASLLLYGAEESRMDGLRLKGVTVAQSGGIAHWTNCELAGPGSYAMAAGAALISNCTFRKYGGVFATYDVAPWSLLVRRCAFENCREGVILGSNPGEARLIVEKNHFLATQGAHIRAMPIQNQRPSDSKNADELEILIGENWYGSSIPEEVDMRIVDRRTDPTVRARLNTRPVCR